MTEKKLPKLGQEVRLTWRLDGGELGRATYLGEEPYKIMLCTPGGQEFELIDYDQGLMWRRTSVLKFHGKQRVFHNERDGNGRYHYYAISNPRFMLSDGSRVWGAECKWEE